MNRLDPTQMSSSAERPSVVIRSGSAFAQPKSHLWFVPSLDSSSPFFCRTTSHNDGISAAISRRPRY